MGFGFDAFEVQFFSGLHFYTIPKTLIACTAMQLRYFKVKTLLNDAFKVLLKLCNTKYHCNKTNYEIIIMFRSYIAHITSKWRLYALEALLPQL